MNTHSTDNTCCKDEQVTAKISDSHIGNAYYYCSTLNFTEELIVPTSYINLLETSGNTGFTYVCPVLRIPPSYKQYHILFRNIRV